MPPGRMTSVRAAALLLTLVLLPAGVRGQAGPAPKKRFDPEEATRAYLAKVPPEKKARSDAYYQGGYWLHLWEFLYAVWVAGTLLATKSSARFRDLAERTARARPLQTYLYWLQYVAVTAALLFPWTLYRRYFREREYGLATQTFGPWMADRFKELAVLLVLDGIAVVLLYEVLARSPRRWWLWGSLAATALVAVSFLIAPVFVFP